MTWQMLFRHWLRRTAEVRLREAMAAGLASSASDAPGGRIEERLRPSHVAVIMPSAKETAGLIDRLSGVIAIDAGGRRLQEGGYDGRRLAVLAVGDERQAIADATAALVEGHQPGWVIAAGFATALVSRLKHGDVVVADELVEARDVDPRESSKCQVPEPLVGLPRWHAGRILLAEQAEIDEVKKRHAGDACSALAAQCGSVAVADICRQLSVPLLSLGVIRWTRDEQRPGILRGVRAQRSMPGKIGALAGAVFRRPSSLKDLWYEKEQDLVATDRLAQAVLDAVERLVPRGAPPGQGTAAEAPRLLNPGMEETK